MSAIVNQIIQYLKDVRERYWKIDILPMVVFTELNGLAQEYNSISKNYTFIINESSEEELPVIRISRGDKIGRELAPIENPTMEDHWKHDFYGVPYPTEYRDAYSIKRKVIKEGKLIYRRIHMSFRVGDSMFDQYNLDYPLFSDYDHMTEGTLENLLKKGLEDEI